MITSFKMALRSIGSSKLRAVLTMLGIIIGVMALVVLVSLVNGATNSVTDAVSELGSSMISVTVVDDKGKPIDMDTLDTWMAEEKDLGLLAPYQSESLVGKFGSEYGTVTVYGTTPEYYDIQAMQLSMGRWLRDADVSNNSYVCILNHTAAEDLVGYEDCVGQKVVLNGVEFTVIGVLEEDDETLAAMLTAGSMSAYIPYTSLVRLSSTLKADIGKFYLSAPEGGVLKTAENRIDEILLERFNEDEDAYRISTSDMLEEAMDDITSVLSVLLGGIAAISLVVGGIGIMNIMMVTVTERTREIGIRKAIGASRGTILTQFLMEAVVLCMMGCVMIHWISAVSATIAAICSRIGTILSK